MGVKLMIARIDKIKVIDRIRKEITKIDELAADIQINGLLNPVTVMPLEGGEFRLLAGLRRLRAAQMLGYSEITVNVVSPADAEAELRIEISENEQREPFTFSEKMDFARMLEEIEQAKAKERMSLGGKGGIDQEGKDGRPYLEGKQSRDAVGEKIGMSGRQYSRAKHIAENAPEEMIEELDKGQRSINQTYEELRSKESSENLPSAVNQNDHSVGAGLEIESETESDFELEDGPEAAKAGNKQKSPDDPKAPTPISKADQEAMRRNAEFHAMTTEEKVVELQRRLHEACVRATHAESELSDLKIYYKNIVYHKDGNINNLMAQLENAEALLEKAVARVKELERLYCSDTKE